jgi:uncharacterized repeat protein (TIGR03803 family)
MDSAGNLHGTTYSGGANGYGTVFKIGLDGTESVLHSFVGSPGNGMSPQAGLPLLHILGCPKCAAGTLYL